MNFIHKHTHRWPLLLALVVSITLALFGLLAWSKRPLGGASSVVHAQSNGQQALNAARTALTQAQATEKTSPTKQHAVDVDTALSNYNAAVGLRITEIRSSLKDLAKQAETSGKTATLINDTETLETELRSLQSVVAGPTPTTSPEVEPNDTTATANTINLSGSAQPCAIVSATINPGNDVDFFTFTGAPAGSRIWIETDTGGTQNAGATSRDTVIDLLAADGTTVIENDDDDGTGNGGDGTVETGLASMIGGRTLTAGGTYFIRVRAFSATAIINPYRLFVVLTNTAATPEVEANNTAATANPIVTAGVPTGIRSGSIGAAGDADYYSVVATAGNIIYLNTDADPERDGTGTDLVVEVRDPADVLLLSVDSSITGSLANPAAEGANFTVVTSGTYFIKVRHFSATGTGTYHLMVTACNGDALSSPTPIITPETEPNNTAPTANVINLSVQPCAIVSAAINPGNDVDFFTFTGAPAGSRIWIETDTGGTQNAGATSRDTVIDLLAADGTTVIENDDDDGTGNGGDGTVETGLASMVGGRTLTAGGTYFIRVHAFSATGIVNPYRLFVVLTNTAATAEVEANNTAATANSLVTGSGQMGLRSGSIGTAGDADYYTVVATAGNIVYFNVDADPERDGTGTDLVVEFRDPADVLLLSVDSSITGSLANPAAEGANFTITSSGTYFIRVRHFSATGTGTYHIMASACSGGGSSCAISCPANVTVNTDPNQCGAVVTYPAPTTGGTCGTVTCSPASGSFFPAGTTTVTCTASAGGSCSFTVTVNDSQGPSITCPANITKSNDPNQCGAVVTYPAPIITDNCPGSFTATCVPPSGSFFPVGLTTVTCTIGGTIPNGGGNGCTTITESTSQTITPLNSVSCNDGFGHTNNSYWRAFSLPSFGINNTFNVTSVDIGIEDAISGGGGLAGTRSSASAHSIGKNPKTHPPSQNGGGSQPITVRLYTSNQAFPSGFPGSLTQIGTATVNLADQSGTIVNIPVAGVAPAGAQLVVEIFTPDGTATGNLIFIGSNASPETGPSYLSAPDCGVNTPTTTAALNFPGMHIVMNVNGCQQVVAGASCSFTVRVQDTQAPSITCPPNQFVGTVSNSAVVSYPPPTASDNCPGVTVSCTPPSGSSFNVGVTTVTCTAVDASPDSPNSTCTFQVTVNRVSASISDPLACTGPGNKVTVTLNISNNGNVNQNVVDTTTFTNLVGLPNTCVANVGTCTVTNAGVSYSGTLTPGQTAVVTYMAQVGDLVTPGSQVCANNSVTFNGGPAVLVTACATVTCPPPGPGGIFPTTSEASDQKAGSVLIYNIYTSGATSGNTQNTRISITNAHPLLTSFVHLFFVAEGCSIADSYICLTGNQTASFLASDLDPGTTGYIVALAVNSIGCPTSFNYLIGDEYVKFSSGHAANLGAIAFSQIAGGLPLCDGNSVTATLNFDGVSYNRVPAVLALDSVGSRADGNDTLLIVNRIGGNLGIGASTLSTIFGILYDDAENSLSFSVSGNCQLRNSLSNNFPRTTPRFETFIPAGRTGWLKIFNQTAAIGITGSAINFNANAASSAGAFNQGHNLHHLTLTTSSYVIPLFPPSC